LWKNESENEYSPPATSKQVSFEIEIHEIFSVLELASPVDGFGSRLRGQLHVAALA